MIGAAAVARYQATQVDNANHADTRMSCAAIDGKLFMPILACFLSLSYLVCNLVTLSLKAL